MDQLESADAGSWQIADRYATASSVARGLAVFDFRVRPMLEPPSWSLNYAHIEIRDGRQHGGALLP